VTTTAWVVGARGLLGHAVSRAVASRRGWRILPAEPLEWSRPDRAKSGVTENLDRLVESAAGPGDRWCVIWAAGAAVTSSSQEQLADELSFLRGAVDLVARAASDRDSDGAFFYASSAGGIYSGSSRPPFDETAAVAPI
jgi:UDP-glucose 4-epimerase